MNAGSTQVVLAGHVCIDVNVSEGPAYTSWGSALMYMAHYFERNQPDVSAVLVAPYGRDFMQYAGGLTLLPPPQGDDTLIYKNYSHGGHRTQQAEHTDSAEPPSLTEDIIQRLEQADIICLAPLLANFSADYARDLLSHRRPDSKTVLLPQGYFRTVGADGRVTPKEFEEADKIIPLFDMVILSEDDHPDSHRLTKQWASQASSSNIIMTLGAKGASWVRPEEVVTVPVEAVREDQIVDTVGCGDTFAAAAMYSYYRDGDIMTAIKAGNAAARAKLFQTPY